MSQHGVMTHSKICCYGNWQTNLSIYNVILQLS